MEPAEAPKPATVNPFLDNTANASLSPPVSAEPATNPDVTTTPNVSLPEPEVTTTPNVSLPEPEVPVPVAAVQQPAENQRESPISPQVAALRGMFPDFDDSVLQYVLESVGGDQDRAIDTLLGMSDPDYRSESRPVAPPLTQSELDEQLARQIADEDQRQEHEYLQQQRRPYEPRQSRQTPSQLQQQQQGGQHNNAGEKDTMAELTEQFSKFAETGKKTFGSIFSKVKAKINEFDQPRPNQGSSSNPGSQPQWNAENTQYYAAPAQPPPQQHPSYDPYSQPSMQPTGYDAAPAPIINAASHPANETRPVPSSTPAPPATSQGAPIDGGKLGLLPKRPVSLLQPSGQPARKASDDDEDLEYVENPFEENRK